MHCRISEWFFRVDAPTSFDKKIDLAIDKLINSDTSRLKKLVPRG